MDTRIKKIITALVVTLVVGASWFVSTNDSELITVGSLDEKVVAIEDTERVKGNYTSTAFEVPEETTWVTVKVDKTEWENKEGEVVQYYVDISEDGGKTWHEIGGAGTSAELSYDRQGNLLDYSAVSIQLPEQFIGKDIISRTRFISQGQTKGKVEVSFDDASIVKHVPQTHNSVTFGTAGATSGVSVTSLTVSSLAVGSQSNRLLVAGMAGWDATLAQSAVSGVTFNGSGVGFSSVTNHTNGNNFRSTIWRLIAPANATANVVASFAGTADEVGMSALWFYDVDQTTPIGTPNTGDANDNAVSVTVAGVDSDDMVYDCVWAEGDNLSISIGADQTQRANNIAATSGSYTTRILASTQPGTAGGAMTWGIGGTANQSWLSSAIVIKVAAAPPASGGFVEDFWDDI